MKRALIVAATGGFLKGFLISDMKLLQKMGYEVHCAANGNSVSTFVPEELFASIGVMFHQHLRLVKKALKHLKNIKD